MSKCIGCGITLQNTSVNNPGYVQDLSFKYCERCFRNVNYSEIKDANLNVTNNDIINKINRDSSLTFFCYRFFKYYYKHY